MAWLVQTTVTLWIMGGCYCRYVDKIDTNTILLISSIPCHWDDGMLSKTKVLTCLLGKIRVAQTEEEYAAQQTGTTARTKC